VFSFFKTKKAYCHYCSKKFRTDKNTETPVCGSCSAIKKMLNENPKITVTMNSKDKPVGNKKEPLHKNIMSMAEFNEKKKSLKCRKDFKRKPKHANTIVTGVEWDIEQRKYLTYICEFDQVILMGYHNTKTEAVISRWYAELERHDISELKKSKTLAYLLSKRQKNYIISNQISVLGVDFENDCLDMDSILILKGREAA
jgi:hemoglobin-like flavoprotein